VLSLGRWRRRVDGGENARIWLWLEGFDHVDVDFIAVMDGWQADLWDELHASLPSLHALERHSSNQCWRKNPVILSRSATSAGISHASLTLNMARMTGLLDGVKNDVDRPFDYLNGALEEDAPRGTRREALLDEIDRALTRPLEEAGYTWPAVQGAVTVTRARLGLQTEVEWADEDATARWEYDEGGDAVPLVKAVQSIIKAAIGLPVDAFPLPDDAPWRLPSFLAAASLRRAHQVIDTGQIRPLWTVLCAVTDAAEEGSGRVQSLTCSARYVVPPTVSTRASSSRRSRSHLTWSSPR